MSKRTISPLKKEAARQKREELKSLSKAVQGLIKLGAFDTINEGILHTYKEETGATEFKTFWGWVHSGYKVKKGETSFPVWAKPIKIKDLDLEELTEEKERKYWPICNLFGDHQVEKAEKKITNS